MARRANDEDIQALSFDLVIYKAFEPMYQVKMVHKVIFVDNDCFSTRNDDVVEKVI